MEIYVYEKKIYQIPSTHINTQYDFYAQLFLFKYYVIIFRENYYFCFKYQ